MDKQKKLTNIEKIARALFSQKEWGNELEACKGNINKLQGEIDSRIADIIEDDPKKTFDSIMEEVQTLMYPSQEQIIKESVKKTIKKTVKK